MCNCFATSIAWWEYKINSNLKPLNSVPFIAIPFIYIPSASSYTQNRHSFRRLKMQRSAERITLHLVSASHHIASVYWRDKWICVILIRAAGQSKNDLSSWQAKIKAAPLIREMSQIVLPPMGDNKWGGGEFNILPFIDFVCVYLTNSPN